MALHTSTFCCNGSVTLTRNRNGMHCSRVDSFAVFHNVSSASRKKYNVRLANAFEGGYEHLFPSTLRHIKSRKANFMQGPSNKLLVSCQLKGENSSSERITLDAQTLEQDLQNAIAEEDYTKAAIIRDSLRALQEDSKSSVLAANAKFYESFRTGDLAAMQVLWAQVDSVCCVHPGTRGISGYDDVMTSWEYVWANYEFPLEIQLKELKVHARGDMGYVTCVELVKTKGSSWGGQFVTNVFERINGQWFICIHHASPVDL